MKQHEDTESRKLIYRSHSWSYTAVIALRLNSKKGVY